VKQPATEWCEIEAGLAGHDVGRRPRAASDFWADFQARVALYPQSAGPAPKRARAPWLWALGGAGATALALAVTWFGPWQATAHAGTDVLSYRISAPHDAIMIWRDEATAATILWVATPETPALEQP
jgi:hypothetical protein